MTTKVDSWPPSVWTQINGSPGSTPPQPGLLTSVMTAIRVANKVFPSTTQGNDDPVSADTIDLKTGIPTVGVTRPVVSITRQFQLADLQVDSSSSPNLPVVMNQVTLTGQTLALMEDSLFFQGRKARIPHGVTVTVPADLQDGLLGIAEANHKIPVRPRSEGGYGTGAYEAVVKGISEFSANLQAPPYALILDPVTFGDANSPLPETMVTPASAIQALVQGGFYMSPGLPPRTGLLAALGGGGTSLVIGTAPVVEYTNTDGRYYYFTARESIQFCNIDPRSLIALDFQPGSDKRGLNPRTKSPAPKQQTPNKQN
jgi:uncharacterized linocin/CFP29 family protein